jgi:hypothetical protein
MLINTDSETFQELLKLRQRQRAYEEIGDFVKAKEDYAVFNGLISLAAGGLIKLIDEAIKGDDYAQEQIDTARTLGEGE